MDIQVASNFERALFEAAGRDANWTAQAMSSLPPPANWNCPRDSCKNLKARYSARAVSDDETAAQIARFHKKFGRLIDPHTAVAATVAETIEPSAQHPVVILSTAHPAKFPDIVRKATGISPEVPDDLQQLTTKAERADTLPPDVARIRAYITETLAR